MEKQIIAVIDALSEKLGIAKNEMLPEYEKIMKVEGIMQAGTGIVLIILATLLSSYAMQYEPNVNYEFFSSVVGFIIWIFFIVIFFVSISEFQSGIKKMTAPKGMAIQKLIKDIRGE